MTLLESKDNGGPYSKNQRRKRRDEVFRLHFELGYSARKISQLMNINRNTINSDLKFAYSQLSSEWSHGDIYSLSMKQIYRLELQRRRLLEELKKQSDVKEKLAIEKMIYDIDCRIFQFYEKFSVSNEFVLDWVIDTANDIVEGKKLKGKGFVNERNIRMASKEAYTKINKILVDDAINTRSKTGI